MQLSNYSKITDKNQGIKFNIIKLKKGKRLNTKIFVNC